MSSHHKCVCVYVGGGSGGASSCSCEVGLERNTSIGSITEYKRSNVWINKYMDPLHKYFGVNN